jgi:uncharacterized protein
MGAAFTYPGVYIQELPSGLQPITGVATSIAAFVGWADQGPINEATLVQSWGDFQRQFGGLDSRSYLGYAVNQFFGNGGQQAYIVRLVDPASAKAASVTITGLTFNSSGSIASPPTPSTVSLTTVTLSAWQPSTAYTVGELIVDSNGNAQRCTTAGTSGVSEPTNWATTIGMTTQDGVGGTAVTWTLVGSITFSALSPGAWGDNYSAQIQPLATDYTRFTLSVLYTNTTTNTQSTVESFPNLSLNPVDTQARYVANIINEQSNFITASKNSAVPAITNTPSVPAKPVPSSAASVALSGAQDGNVLTPTTVAGTPGPFEKALNVSGSATGVHLLDTVPIFNLLCVPGEMDPATISSLQQYCVGRRAFLIVDSASTDTFVSLQNGPNSAMTGSNAMNSAFYFPWINAFDPQLQTTRSFPPCGFVAGLYAATDASRGVWKAPAGIDASLSGEAGLALPLTDNQNGTLNVQAINCLRNFRVYGDVIWGARTLQGNDQIGSQWKYVPIRRLALFLESSLYEGTQWAVFEPNDERLWGQLRLNIGSFMQGLFLQGAFQGTTPQQAYFVKCDSENNPQSSIDQGIVTVLVGFAPLYPAEFVVIQIQQMAGQAQS